MLNLLTVLTAMASIQSGAAIAKGLFATIGPAGVTCLRIGFAAVMLLVVFRPRLRQQRDALKWVILYGLSLGVMNLTFYFALARIPLGAAVAIEFVGPLVVALLDSRRPLDLLWVALAGLGITALSPVGPRALDATGVSLALVAGACWALYIIFGQRAGRVLNAGTVTSLGMVVAAFTVMPFANQAVLDPANLPAGLLVALMSSAIPYSLEMIAMRRMPARRFGLLMSLEPVVATTSGFLILGERLDAWHVVAIALIVSAVIGSTLAPKLTPASAT